MCRRVQGRHPLQTSDALGAASTHVGPHAVALMVLLNKQLGLSHGKVAALCRRGFDQAAAVLGADLDGVLVRDGWAPYRRFDQAAHQTCLAHLIRRCREIAEAHPRAAWPPRVASLTADDSPRI